MTSWMVANLRAAFRAKDVKRIVALNTRFYAQLAAQTEQK